MSVPRSQRASTPAEIRGTERARRDLPLGVWGMFCLILTEGALFTMVIGSYWYLRYRDQPWPPAGVPDPRLVLPLVLTAALIASVVPVFLASAAARRGAGPTACSWLGLALLVQCGYLAVQIVLLRDDLHEVGARSSAYGSAYVAMVVLHHAHVVLGLLLDGALLSRIAGGLTAYRVTGLRAIAWYWAFVAGVGVPVVLTQVSPSL